MTNQFFYSSFETHERAYRKLREEEEENTIKQKWQNKIRQNVQREYTQSADIMLKIEQAKQELKNQNEIKKPDDRNYQDYLKQTAELDKKKKDKQKFIDDIINNLINTATDSNITLPTPTRPSLNKSDEILDNYLKSVKVEIPKSPVKQNIKKFEDNLKKIKEDEAKQNLSKASKEDLFKEARRKGLISADAKISDFKGKQPLQKLLNSNKYIIR